MNFKPIIKTFTGAAIGVGIMFAVIQTMERDVRITPHRMLWIGGILGAATVAVNEVLWIASEKPPKQKTATQQLSDLLSRADLPAGDSMKVIDALSVIRSLEPTSNQATTAR